MKVAAVRGRFEHAAVVGVAEHGNSAVLVTLAALFPTLEVRERAIVVAVHLPVDCRGTLFIENQDTYTAACDGAPRELRGLALVYAAGFRSAAARARARHRMAHRRGCRSRMDRRALE